MTVGRLSPGVRIALSGKVYTVVGLDVTKDEITLADTDGVVIKMGQPAVVRHKSLMLFEPDYRAPHRALVERLTAAKREVLDWRVEHLREVETGYRSGDPEHALAHEPKPEYDPALTTLTQRRWSKAAELNTESAKRSGERMSYGTIVRLGLELKMGMGLDGVVDKRDVRRSPGQYRMTDLVEQACWAVYDETCQRSNVTWNGRYTMIKQWTRDQVRAQGETWDAIFTEKDPFPSPATVRRWHKQRFTKSEVTGKARTRRSATQAPTGGFNPTYPTRVGELIVMDSNSLDTLLAGTAYEGAVQGVLVLSADWYSRSVVSARIVETSETAIDVTFALLDMMRPMELRPGWGDEQRWPFVGVPEAMVGANASARPVVQPESTVLDHGNTYKNRLVVSNQERLGISILPARTFTGSDKSVVERFFESLKTGLLEHLAGFRGSDTSERGADVDDNVRLDAQGLEDLILWWCVTHWQNHVMTTVKPPWCPDGDWSPNMLYQHGIATHGISVRLGSTNDYASMLDFTAVKIGKTGIVVKGLTYDGPELDPIRGTLAPYEGGTKKGKWTVRYDRRDLNHVYLLAANGDYLELSWVGSHGTMPPFTDRHVNAMRRMLTDNGRLRAYSDEELRDILLTEVLEVHDPVEHWRINGGPPKEAAPVDKMPGKPKTTKAASRSAREHAMQAQDKERHGATPEPDAAPASTVDPLTEGRRKRRQSSSGPVKPAAPMTKTSFFGVHAIDLSDSDDEGGC